MKHQQIADFHGVSLSTVRHWPKDVLNRKEVEAEAGAEPAMMELIAEIARLSFVYDCKHMQGVKQMKSCIVQRTSVFELNVMFYSGASMTPDQSVSINLDASDAIAKLEVAKMDLENKVYGATHAR